MTSVRNLQKGVSLIEFMVGITLGLIVAAGITALAANSLATNTSTTKAIRLNQQLRAAMDMVVQELRRAGHVCAYNAIIGTSTGYSNGVAVSNGGDTVEYQYELCDAARNFLSTEQSGFRLASGKLQKKKNGAWTDVTDTTGLTMTSISFCYEPGSASTCLTEPPSAAKLTGATNQVVVKNIKVTLLGYITGDSAASRKLVETVMVRNDDIVIP